MLSKILRFYCARLSKFSFAISCNHRKFHLNSKKSSSRADYRMAPHVFRQKKMYTATVVGITNASPTIKVLRFFIKETGFSFKAGQWVDFYVPGMQDVTGYSMTSAPNESKSKGILELAVKYGKFPPTHWVHNHCKVGQKVQIRVGGDFYYDPLSNKTEEESNLLLVGGGVGINPLVSILLEYRDLLLATDKNRRIQRGKVHLLYSARTEEELVFRDTFDSLEKEYPSLTCQYFITQSLSTHRSPEIHYTRIQEKNVADSIHILDAARTLCYICGPSTMTDDVAAWLLKLNLKAEQIRYEKWW